MAADPIKKLIQDYKHRAKLKGYRFDFTYSEFKALVTSPCVYCFRDPQPRVWTRGIRNTRIEYNANGVDRIDSNFGYTENNCVSCCATCNTMKGAMSHTEFIAHLKRILSNYIT